GYGAPAAAWELPEAGRRPPRPSRRTPPHAPRDRRCRRPPAPRLAPVPRVTGALTGHAGAELLAAVLPLAEALSFDVVGRVVSLTLPLAYVLGALSALDAVMKARTPQGSAAWAVALVAFPIPT